MHQQLLLQKSDIQEYEVLEVIAFAGTPWSDVKNVCLFDRLQSHQG